MLFIGREPETAIITFYQINDAVIDLFKSVDTSQHDSMAPSHQHFERSHQRVTRVCKELYLILK